MDVGRRLLIEFFFLLSFVFLLFQYFCSDFLDVFSNVNIHQEIKFTHFRCVLEMIFFAEHPYVIVSFENISFLMIQRTCVSNDGGLSF